VPPGRIALLTAVVAAVVFGAAFPALVLPDSGSYMEPARSWARGEGLMESPGRALEYRLPVFPLLLGLVFRVFGESLRAVSLVHVVLHVGAMLLARALVRRVHAGVADWSAAAAILYPPFLTAAATVLQETLLAFLAAVFAWSLWRAAEDEGLGRPFAAGLSLGVAALGKVVILPLALPAALLLLFVPRRSWLRPAVFVLGVVLVVLPWAVRNRVVLGRFEVTNNNGGHTLLGGAVTNDIRDWYGFPEYRAAVAQWEAGERRHEPVLDRYLYRMAVERIQADPGRWLGLVAGRVVRFMLPARHWMGQMGLSAPGTVTPFFVIASMFQAILFLATALLAIDVARRRAPVAFLIGPAIVFWHLAVYAVVYVSPRYNVTVGPLLVVSAAQWWARRYRS
jgi:4-amino-4-deoxy-L-arabinose transferase-like glycosyltransferase